MAHLEIISGEYYKTYYKAIHYKGSLGKFTHFYHRALEKGRVIPYLTVLEVGSGDGEHLKFVTHEFERYFLLEPYPGKNHSNFVKSNQKLKSLKAFAENIPLKNSSVDRIISTCVLSHVSDVNKVLLELRRVAKPGAILDLYLPMDPGMLYRYIRHLTSHRKTARNMGNSMLSVKYLWANEHKNHFLGIKSSIRYIFQNDQIKFSRYPFPWFSWNFNLFSVVKIIISDEKT